MIDLKYLKIQRLRDTVVGKHMLIKEWTDCAAMKLKVAKIKKRVEGLKRLVELVLYFEKKSLGGSSNVLPPASAQHTPVSLLAA